MPLPPLQRVFFIALALMLLLGGCVQPVVWNFAPTPTTDLTQLADQLASEYGLEQALGRLVTVQPIAGADETPLFAAHTHGFPSDNAPFRQKVSIHTEGPAGWTELGRVELECAELLNESSLEQVKIDPAEVWLTVEGGVGAHSGCLELLRWDGETLAVVISGFSSSPDAGSLVLGTAILLGWSDVDGSDASSP